MNDEKDILSRRPTQAELDAVSLSGRDLSGVVLRKLNLEGRDLRGVSFVDAVLNGVNFDQAELEGANFSGAEIDGSRFVGAKMKGACLEGVRGEGVDFSQADLTSASLKEADLGNVDFSGACLNEALLEGARWVQVKAEGLSAKGIHARGWVLDDAKLKGARLDNAELVGAVFQLVDLGNASVAGANFRKARLFRPRLEGADLSEIQAEEAQVKGIKTDSVEARQFVRAGARVGGFWAQMKAGRASQKAREARGEAKVSVSPWLYWGVGLPLVFLLATKKGAKPAVMLVCLEALGAFGLHYWSQRGVRAKRVEDLKRVGPGVDLRGGQLRGSKLVGRDLRGIDLRGAFLQGANLSGADLTGAKLDGARLDRCRLVGARLEGVSAKGACFDDAKLNGAVLKGLQAPDSRWVGADLREAQFEQVSLICADLSAARLSDLDLKDTDLSGALLEQCDLASSQLQGVKVDGMEAEGALGLTSGELANLEARGARVNALSLDWLKWFSASEGRATRISRFAALLLVLLIGGFLVAQYLGSGSLSDEELEGRALEAAERGDIDSALARYDLLFERSDQSAEKMVFLFEKASLLTEAGRHTEAISTLQAAVDFAEEPVDQAEVALRLAKAYGSSGALEQEIAGYEALVQREDLPPDLTARALVALSEVTARMGFPERALALHEEVLQRFGNNPTVVLRVNMSAAELLAARGQYADALAAIERISAFPLEDIQRAELMVLEASLYEEQGLQGKSLEIYKKLKTRYPEYRDLDGQVLLSMARLTARQGESEGAQVLLSELLDRGGRPSVMARSRLLLGQIAEDQGDLTSAMAAYREVLESEGLDRDAEEAARVALANVLLASGSSDAELMLGKMIADGEPELASQALLGQAHAALELGDTDKARGVSERVLAEFKEVAGAESAAKTLLAQILVAEGRYPEAVRAYRGLLEGAQRSDERVVLQASISDALLQGGRVKEAQSGFESMLKTDGEHPEAGPLARLGLARVAETLGDHEKARRLYQQVAENAEDPALRASGLEYLALAYLDSGRDQDAMTVYRRFVETLPDGHDAVFSARLAMAGILMRRGDRSQAQIQYEALLSEANTPERSAEVEFALGELREESGDLPGALASYASIRTRGTLPLSRRVEAGLGLARVQLALGQPAESLRIAEETEASVQTGSIKVSLLQLRIQALQALGRAEEADQLSSQLIDVAGDDEDARMAAEMELARSKANDGDFSGAISLYSSLGKRVRDRPTKAAMEISIAKVHAQSGDTSASRAAFQSVLERYGTLVDTRFECEMGLANVDRIEGKAQDALLRYQSVETVDVGSDIWRREQLAQTHWELDDFEAARVAYEQIQERYPEEPAALAASKSGLASIARAQGELELARGLFNQVAELARDRSQREWARLNAASILSEQGRYDDAFFALREVAGGTSDPEIALQAKLGMAAVFQEKGRFEQALELLDTADAENLGPAWAASLTQAQVSSEIALGKLDLAEDRWNGLLQNWSDHDEAKSQAQLGLADIALQKGKHEEALNLFGAVAEGSVDRFFQAQAQIGLGRVLVADGKPQRAADRLEAVIRDFPDQPEMTSVALLALEGMTP